MEHIGTPRVAHVISDAGPHPYFRTLIESGGLERTRLVVGSVGPAGALHRDMNELGVTSFALGAKSRIAFPVAVARLAALLRRHGVQVVQTHLLDGSVVGLTAARLAGTPVRVMTAHHSHELPFHGWRLRWPEYLCSGPLSDHIIAPSIQVAQTLERWVGVSPEKIEVVHHGFDLDRLSPSAVDGSRVRSELGLETKLVLGSIGRIYPLKNYPALLEAFAAVAGDVAELRLVVAGAGDAEPLRRLSRSLGVADRIVFCGPRADVPELLGAFDVFVHPAIAESFGMVIVEAMAMARPVVSTPVGIAPEVIEPFVTGFLSASDHPRALAAALREALDRRCDWPCVGTNARRRVAGFTARTMAARYEQLYVRWLTEAAHSGPQNSDLATAMPMEAPGADASAGPTSERSPDAE